MVHPYSLKTQHMWDRSELLVQVLVPGNERPIAYCDGTDEDIEALREIAEAEGVDMPVIHRRILKTGRQIWTMGGG